MVIGGSLFFRSDDAPVNGTEIEALFVSAHELAQPPSRSLGDLAVLLTSPAAARTELGTVDLLIDLGGDHFTLIRRKPVQQTRDPLKFHPHLHLAVQIGLPVDHLLLRPAEEIAGERVLEPSLSGAATLERATTVVDPRDEALLENSRDVRHAHIRGALASAGYQLQRRLAIAIFEVLPAQPVGVHAQQPPPVSLDHERDTVCRIFM